MTDRDRLDHALAAHGPLTIAVSGGVDSMTLAHIAHGPHTRMIHAAGPAVPPEATARVRDHAARHGWVLAVLDAGEYADPNYRANPVNRCYFCKTNLYDRVAEQAVGPIASGANLDDLGDYRPGLIAAAERNVVHPFVEAKIDKAGVRALAAALGLTDLAELPAQPCLASRVETGIRIDAGDLAFIHRVEQAVGALTGPGDIRCRVTAQGVRLELPEALSKGRETALDALARSLCAEEGRAYAGRAPYARGSAFLHPK